MTSRSRRSRCSRCVVGCENLDTRSWAYYILLHTGKSDTLMQHAHALRHTAPWYHNETHPNSLLTAATAPTSCASPSHGTSCFRNGPESSSAPASGASSELPAKWGSRRRGSRRRAPRSRRIRGSSTPRRRRIWRRRTSCVQKGS